MFKSRVFQILVCVALICCMIFNYAAIPAKASALGAIAVGTCTGAAAAGVAATLFAVAMGIVAVGLTAQLVIDIGKDLRQSGIDFYQSDTDKQTQWTTWIDGLGFDLSGTADDIFSNLAGNTLVYDVLQNWGAKLMQGEGIETDGAAAPEGFAYYNGVLLPIIRVDADHSYSYIVKSGTNFQLFNSKIPWQLNNGAWRGSANGGHYYIYGLNNSSTAWSYITGGTTNINAATGGISLVWSNSDVTDFSGSNVLIGSDPVYVDKTIVQPSIYVGDLPQKIQNGEADEDDIVIPDINYTKIFEGQTDAVSALDQVATQLANGTLTYEDYLELTKAQTLPGTNTGTNTGTITGVWSPPANPGQFALDLSNYFPFCIPFDLYDFFSCLNADPVAPVIHWEIALPGGSTYPIELDLSPFDSVAQLLRRLQLLLFIVGLAIKTRDLIKG